MLCFFFKQKTAYVMRISDWSSDVCSSDLSRNMSDDQRKSATDSTRPASPASSAARVMGGIFLVVGFLVMTLSGLCTGVAVISTIGRASCRERVCQYV